MHVHISGIDGLIVLGYVLVGTGVLNLLAMKYKETNKLAASYANLYGLN